MSYHVFTLIWGDEFARDYLDTVAPTLRLSGNVPALACHGPVTFHIYTDRKTKGRFGAEFKVALGDHAHVQMHDFSQITVGDQKLPGHVRGLESPALKYEIQHHCLKSLISDLIDEPGAVLVLLDSNFVLANGAFEGMLQRLKAGKKAVMVDVLRLDKSGATEIVRDLVGNNMFSPCDAIDNLMAHLHPITRSFFVDAEAFSPYPSQVCWQAGHTSFLARSFIPHPLAIAVSPGMTTLQSTMDYDLALRAWPDDDIDLITDSDDVLVMKLSGAEHQADRPIGGRPTPKDLALFALTSTHSRHRHFAEKPIRFHGAEMSDWQKAEHAADRLIGDAYDLVERIIANAGHLDASMLAYIKSYAGPIETFLSPQLDAQQLAPIRAGTAAA